MDSHDTTNPQQSDGKKKRRHRGGKRKKNRRQSFAAPSEGTDIQSVSGMPDGPLVDIPEDQRAPFYRMRSNLSDESLDSEALLDHR